MHDLAVRSTEIATLRASLAKCTEDQAEEFAVILAGAYSRNKFNNYDAFVLHLITLFTDYPANACEWVCKYHWRNHEWLNLKEVTASLEEQVKGRRRQLSDAVQKLEQAKRFAEDERFANETPEEREAEAAKVRDLIGGITARNAMPGKGNAAPKSGESESVSALPCDGEDYSKHA